MYKQKASSDTIAWINHNHVKICAGNKSLDNSKTTGSLISTGMTYIRKTH